MCVGVNLHPYLEHLRVRSPKFNDCVRRVKAIDVDLQITTVVAQRIRLRELARHHDHSVKGTSNNPFVGRIVSSRGARNPHVPERTLRLLRSGLLTLHPQK